MEEAEGCLERLREEIRRVSAEGASSSSLLDNGRISDRKNKKIGTAAQSRWG
jgi:hypothetical protein